MFEQESRRDRAADERVSTERFCTLPRTRRHNDLRPLSLVEIASKDVIPDDTVFRDTQRERRTRIPVPDLGRIDAMPARLFARLQKEIDRGAVGAARRVFRIVANVSR